MKQTLQECINIIQTEKVWIHRDMNPTARRLQATIKLHKPITPIRPIINAPAYELTK
jgi:hypothetical protein